MKAGNVMSLAALLIFWSACAEARQNSTPKIYFKKRLPGNYNGFIFPPFGIFIKESERFNERLINHEMMHWKQFQEEGALPFLLNYSYAAANFGYDLNPYEIEARYEETEYCQTNYTECVRTGQSLTVFNPNFRK